MMEYLTPANIALVLSLLSIAYTAWARAYPTGKIATTVEAGKSWVRTYAPAISALIEELAKTGAIPKANKASEFLSKVEYEYAKAHPEAPLLPPAAKAEVVLIGETSKVAFPHEDAVISSSSTVVTKTVNTSEVSGNPPLAPASK